MSDIPIDELKEEVDVLQSFTHAADVMGEEEHEKVFKMVTNRLERIIEKHEDKE